ncbi:imidazoleglycerol-phosphate dehydratase HisB [Balneola sp. MJW-20]|uniref:imidazoleglycerol-phosphate dehydratase HisB n=1 Tax=Gracilimonas aurantiaca TaxID=3234185 RepID=UPI003465FF12
MIIQISNTALSDPEGKLPFRSRALRALNLMTDAGHDISLDASSVSDLQMALLEQERIRLIEDSEASDIQIKGENSELILLRGENKSVFDDWDQLTSVILNEARTSTLSRKTAETDINISLNLDGTGKSDISTGLNFFDHMLEQISRHGFIDMELKCDGDLEVDEHHTIEDVAIALGTAIDEALGNKKGIERYAFVLPMDETQATVAIDLSGRPFLVFEGEFSREYVGDLPTEMVKHFFYSLAMNLKATIHVSFAGDNDHHKIEACFKGLARSLKAAVERNERIKNMIPSSKGTL